MERYVEERRLPTEGDSDMGVRIISKKNTLILDVIKSNYFSMKNARSANHLDCLPDNISEYIICYWAPDWAIEDAAQHIVTRKKCKNAPALA